MQHFPRGYSGKEFIYTFCQNQQQMQKIINNGILNNSKSTVSKHSLGLCEGNTQLGAVMLSHSENKVMPCCTLTCRPCRSYYWARHKLLLGYFGMYGSLKISAGARILLLAWRKDLTSWGWCNLRYISYSCTLRWNLLWLYQVRKTKFGDVLENLW